MIAAILLAAGASRRFGRDNKLLAPAPGGPVLARALRLARAAPVARLILVTGHQHVRVAGAARRIDRRVVVVRARRHARGMGESLAAGARALWRRETRAFLFLADMGALDPRLAGRLLRGGRGAQAVRPVARGRAGHPVLLGPALLATARTLGGEAGLQGAIGALGPRERRLVAADRRVLADADRPPLLRRKVPRLR